jgi:hypothetical protein
VPPEAVVESHGKTSECRNPQITNLQQDEHDPSDPAMIVIGGIFPANTHTPPMTILPMMVRLATRAQPPGHHQLEQ